MTVANIVLLSLAGICALSALVFLVRGIQASLSRSQQPYGVAQQETRHFMQVNFLRAGFMLIISLILLGINGLVPGEQDADISPAPTSDIEATVVATATVDIAVEASETALMSSPSPTWTPPPVTATPTLTATATLEVTNTPSVPTAVVNSPNGLWLREAPGGTQEVELIPHATELELLAGRETVDDLEWQQVRTPDGNEGWVAADFLIFP